MSVVSDNIATSAMLSCDLWCQSCCFTVIHKSSPVASWESKVSSGCTLQKLDGSSRSSYESR